MKVMVEVPVVSEHYGAVLRDALSARRQATIHGLCPACGSSRTVAASEHQVTLEHSTDCNATDEKLLAICEREGVKRLDFEFLVIEL